MTTQESVHTDEVTITDDGRVLNDPTHAEPIGHGNSPAAWSMVFLVLAGVLVAGIGMLTWNMIIVLIGAAIAVGGVVVAFVLRQVGYGVGGSKTKSHH